MHQSAFTRVESLWLPGNLPFASATRTYARARVQRLSSGADEVEAGTPELDANLRHLLIVAAREFEMRLARTFAAGSRGSGRFFRRTALVVIQVAFHCRHPPMARSNDTPHASR